MKIKTSELIDTALDWAVANALGYHWSLNGYFVWHELGHRTKYTKECPPYSTDWAQGGPIIERGHIHTWTDRKDAAYAGHPDSYWVAEMTEIGGIWWGPTPLIAAMRCYVASKLGDEVDVPEELT